jgi:hypothetical protein
MDAETAKAVGTLFLAIVNSLTDDHRAEICATIERAANNPEQSPDNREFYKMVHHAATANVEQLALEIERQANGGRPRLQVIEGGDAA